MADSSLPSYKWPSLGDMTTRRKVRKGTQSCWECKRRKIRCRFAAPQDTACDGCRRRGTPCVSQEFPQCHTEQVGDRLGRVEALVEELVKSTAITPLESLTNNNPDHYRGVPTVGITPSDSAIPAPFGEPVPVVSISPSNPTPLLAPPKHGLHQENLARAKPQIQLPSPLTAITPAGSTQLAGQNEEICRVLLAAWPSERNLNIILSVPVDITGCLYGLICTSYFRTHKAPSPREMLQLPATGSDPVLVARKLLLLGSYLQAVPPGSIQSLSDLGVNHREMMSRVVETVHSVVNCNDELVASIEGIECITMESMYYNNAGNLRRAWLTMRRAMLIAQMMGLHRGTNLSSMKTLECQPGVTPEQIWFRLVQSDRYLSLMLGLPQGAPEVSFFATAKALEDCTPVERLQRIDCVVAGRIIQRNESDINDLASTEEIDRLLYKASMSMAPQWWLIPNLAPSASNSMEVFHETMHLMAQFTHYHLVARLHLPYLLRSLTSGNYEYSKITAVNASREVLARFVAFRSSNPISSYCRGIDFLAFIASTTLCLAHIYAHHHGLFIASDGDIGFFANSLAHQRPGDRGMMERALEMCRAYGQC
jgi:hypothetical protein